MSDATVNRLWCGLALAVAFALALVSAYDAIAAMVGRWFVFDEAYSHGWLVLGVTVLLVARELKARVPRVQPSLTGLVLVTVTASGVALSDVINVRVFQQLGAVALFWAVLVAATGWRTGFRLAIPIGFLIYAVPVWDQLTQPLIEASVAVNKGLLGLWDIHFRVEGAYIHLLDIGTFLVAGGCSGLRYLVVALTLSTLFSALNLSRVRSWLFMHGMAIGLALIVNWIRIFVIIVVGYRTEMESGLIKNHEFFGWLLFAGALILFFFVGNRLIRSEDSGTSVSGSGDGKDGHLESRLSLGRATSALITTVALVLVPSAYSAGTTAAFQPPRIKAPSKLEGWQRDHAEREWQPTVNEPDQVVRAGYENDNPESPVVNLGIWYYAVQEQGRELVQYQTKLSGPERWRRVSVRNGPLASWNTMIIEDRLTDDRRAVAFSYYVAGQWTNSRLAVKALMLRSALRGRRDGALIALNTVCESRDCRKARGRLDKVVTSKLQARLTSRLGPE